MEYSEAIGIPASYEAIEERDEREICYRMAFERDMQEIADLKESLPVFLRW